MRDLMELARAKFWDSPLAPPLGDSLHADAQSTGKIGGRLKISASGINEHGGRVSIVYPAVNRALKLALRASGYPTNVGTLGDRMRALRQSRGMTLEELAKVMEITPQGLSQIENGRTKNVRLDNFLRFCAYFDADPYFVVFGERKGAATGRFRKIQLPET